MPHPRRLVALVGVVVGVASFLAAFLAGVGTAPAAGALSLSQPKADILVDAATGKVLVSDNDHERLHPASTAKIFTALAAVERIPPDGIVTACPNTASIEENKIGFAAGTRWPLSEILAAMMMVSANDAAYAVACTIGGNSLDAFAGVLNETAHDLGVKDSTLGDPAGLDDQTSYKGGPLVSAYDLAIAARNALSVPAIAKWAGTTHYAFTDPQHNHHAFTNHNKMLPGESYNYLGSTGFKTGFTDRAQHTLVATATRNGRTLIAIVLGLPDSGYAEAGALLDAGFAMPADARGTGETLPPVAVSLYADRAADQSSFAKLGGAAPSAAGSTSTAGAGATPIVTVPPSIPVLDSPPLVAPTTVPAVVPAASRSASGSASGSASRSASSTKNAPHHSGGGFFSLSSRTVVVVVILVAAVAFFLRRRAVKRRRALRLAQKRQRAAAMRSGGLPVVDGRYRSGLRLGPPVESHVRIRPAHGGGDEMRRGTG